MGRKKLGEKVKTIYLIGFMGSGKTTIGKALGVSFKFPVLDTDIEISRSTEKTISEIFEAEGEDYFRELETECLRKLPIYDYIITTGGGMVLRKENRSWMKEKGIVVFLDATPEEILRRLEDDQTRPLLSGDKKSKVSKILEARKSLYLEAADLIVETTGKSIDSIVDEIVLRLKKD